jgi:hypothetical protein
MYCDHASYYNTLIQQNKFYVIDILSGLKKNFIMPIHIAFQQKENSLY